MGDVALREAERTWRATGAVEDEARLLLARVRAGALAAGRLELAAWLGHDAARAALGPAAPAGEHVPWDRWGAVLDDAGVQLLLRLARQEREAELNGLLPPHGAEWSARWDELAAAAAARDVDRVEAVEAAARARYDELRDEEQVGGQVSWNILAMAADGAGCVLAGRNGHWLLRRVAERDDPPRAELLAWALGRDHATTGGAPTLEAEVAWLRTRLERGELDDRRLRVAAHAGHAAAAALLGLPAPPARRRRRWDEPEPPVAEVVDWLGRLHALDTTITRRVVLHWAWEASVDVRLDDADDPLTRAAADLMLLGTMPETCDEARAEAVALTDTLRRLDGELRATGWRRLVAPLARRLAGPAHEAVKVLAPGELRRLWVQGALAAAELALDPRRGLSALTALWVVAPSYFRAEALHGMRERAIDLALD